MCAVVWPLCHCLLLHAPFLLLLRGGARRGSESRTVTLPEARSRVYDTGCVLLARGALAGVLCALAQESAVLLCVAAD